MCVTLLLFIISIVVVKSYNDDDNYTFDYVEEVVYNTHFNLIKCDDTSNGIPLKLVYISKGKANCYYNKETITVMDYDNIYIKPSNTMWTLYRKFNTNVWVCGGIGISLSNCWMIVDTK